MCVGAQLCSELNSSLAFKVLTVNNFENKKIILDNKLSDVDFQGGKQLIGAQ